MQLLLSQQEILLFLLWIASIIGLGILGIRQATDQAFDGDTITEHVIPVRAGDTLRLAMKANNHYSYDVSRHGGIKIEHDENDNKVIYSNDIRLIVRSTNDSLAKLMIEKRAEGSSFLNAKKRAEAIQYNYSFEGDKLLLDGYFITDIANKYRDQEVELVLHLPVGTTLYAEKNTYSFHRNDSRYNDILNNGDEEQYLMILNDDTKCLDCPGKLRVIKDRDELDWERELEDEFGNDGDSDRIIINEDGIDINLTDKEDTLKIKIGN